VISTARKIVVFGLDGLQSVKSESGEIIFAEKDSDIHLANFDIIIYCSARGFSGFGRRKRKRVIFAF
jgi:hypothetical protein